MPDDRWLVCPLCGWGKKYKTDRKTNTLNRVELTAGPLIDHRDISGGRGSGFPRISFETLNAIKKQAEYQDLVNGLRKQCLEILTILGE